jgi:hypothetical protein
MKATIGAHPDLPFPFSNGPEPPPDPPGGLREPLPLCSERHERGVATMAALLNHWLGRGKLSHARLIAIANWGLNERGIIDEAVVSRTRNGRQVRGLSWKHLDALAAANEAIWLWQVRGPDRAWARLGPQTGWGVQEDWLDDAIWLQHPDHPDEPLNYGDLAEVLAGYLDLPYLSTALLSPGDARRMSDALSHLLEALIADQGWGPREAVKRLLAAYPIADQARQQRMAAFVVGQASLSREELEAELHALAEMIRVVRALKPGMYGPAELRRELSSDPLRGRG